MLLVKREEKQMVSAFRPSLRIVHTHACQMCSEISNRDVVQCVVTRVFHEDIFVCSSSLTG